MKWWQKLTIDWPCALGDWLWANLVTAPAALLDRLTLRSAARIMLQIVLFAVFFAYFQQIASLDLSFLFYVDANIYLDVFAATFVLVARGQILHLFKMATRMIWRFVRPKFPSRIGTRRRRDAGASRRKNGAGSPKQSDDDPAGLWDGRAFA